MGIKENENVIFSYTRDDAIRDGIFVDVSETAKEAGFKTPVAITTNAFMKYVELPEDYKGCQDEHGRLWDIVLLAAHAARASNKDDDMVTFKVNVRNVDTDKLETVEFWMVVEGNRDGTPGINILLPEDY